MTPGPLRVAAAQATSVAGDVDTNVATAVTLVAGAAERGARVVVLPELFLTGYKTLYAMRPGTGPAKDGILQKQPKTPPAGQKKPKAAKQG